MMDDYEVAAMVADKAIGQNDSYCEKGIPIFKDKKHSWPKLGLIIGALVMVISIAATTYEERCVASGSGRTDRGYTQIAGMGFLLSIGGMLIIQAIVFVVLYYFWGLNRLTRLGWSSTMPDGSMRYSYFSWWAVELGVHAWSIVLTFIAACSAAGGLAKNIKDLDDLIAQNPGSCSYKKEEMGGFDFAIILAFAMLVPLGFSIYFAFKGLKQDHGCCPNPFKPVAGAVRNDSNVDSTVHSV